MGFSEPDPRPPSLKDRLDAIELGLQDLTAEHNNLWAQVGLLRADVVNIFSLIQRDTTPHKFAFSPLERLSSVENALAVLSTKLEVSKP